MTTPREFLIGYSKGGVSNTALENRSVTFGKLCSLFSKPRVGPKDGTYIVRGPVDDSGCRANDSIVEGSLVILDGDSTLNAKTGKVKEGAPAPLRVHETLTRLNVKHLICTSHSHGAKGNRYRVFVEPDRPLADTDELKACVDYLISELHAAGVQLAPVSENYAWSQPWYVPRLRAKGAPFECLAHKRGKPLSIQKCIARTRQQVVAVPGGSAGSALPLRPKEPNALIARYNAEHGSLKAMLGFLTARGYELADKVSIDGQPQYRLMAPRSTSNVPGVVLLRDKNGAWRALSHHGADSDPLARRGPDGRMLAHDAFDLLRILDHNGNTHAALSMIRPIKPKIKIFGGSLADNVQQGIRALAAANPPQVFQRGPHLCRVAHLAEACEVEGCSIPKGTAVIVPLTPADLLIRLCDSATWQKSKGAKPDTTLEDVDPPPKVAQGILALQGEWRGIPSLKAIAETPVIRRDGSIHDVAGYDPTTGLYYEGGCPRLSIPKKPNRKEARRAALFLLKVFAEFPFVNRKTGKAVVMAYILTLMIRCQIRIAPLFAISATTPGTGKGLLIEVCNLIVRGRDAAIMPPISGGNAEEESRKRITALLLQGANSVNLDNWVTPIGGESMNGLLTANEWTDRVLGRSEAVKLPNRVTWAATGNNLTVRGDMVRRTLLVQLDAHVERPELRSFEVGNLTGHVLAHRADLLSAAFTILCAYELAGRPSVEGQALGRFEEWWRRVCAPIIWIGLPDPVQSQEQLRKDDPEMSKLERLLSAWHAVVGGDAVSVAELVATANTVVHGSEKPISELRDALLECAGDRGQVNTKSLGWYLRHFSDRIVGSLRLQRVEGSRCRTPRYTVTAAT